MEVGLDQSTRTDPWSSAFGTMMQRHAGRRLLASIEGRATRLNAFPGDGSLVDAVRRLIDEPRSTH